MQYKTIALELLQQRTELHEQLRLTRRLRPAMESLAVELRDLHLSWIETLSKARPDSDPSQIKSEAMELALKALENHSLFASQMDGKELPRLTNATAIPAVRMSKD